MSDKPNWWVSPITVRYSPNPYTGWRKLLRRLTLRSTLGPTYEFDAVEVPAEPFLTGKDDDGSDLTGFSTTLQPVSAIRRVDA